MGLSLCSPSVHAQGFPIENVVWNQNGFPVSGASITVCAGQYAGTPPCTSPATIYSDLALTQPIPNPITTGSLGDYRFVVAAGVYTVSITASGAGLTPTNHIIVVPFGSGSDAALKPAASDGIQYVTANGSDANDGLSRGTAKATLPAAFASSSCSVSCVIYDDGPETWSTNPFSSFTHQATIYLGPHVFTTNAEIAIPSFIHIQGAYARGSSPGQTTIVAGALFPTTGTVNGGAAIIHLPTTANYVEISDLTINCNNVAASSGFYATDLQENSGLDDVDVVNCVNKGVWMDDSGHTGQNWTINKLTVESPSASAAASYEPLHIDGNVFKSVNDVTLIGASTPSTNCGFISATLMGRISGLHMEQCINGLVLDNFQGGGIGPVQCKGNVTNCVKITATNWTVSDSVFGVVSLAVSSPVLLDQQDNITINTGAFGGGLGLFTLDQATPPHVFYGDGTGNVSSNLILTSSAGGRVTHVAPSTASNFTLTDPAFATTLTGTVASGTATMTTGAIGSGACGATVTVSATGTLTTDTITYAFNAAVTANPGELTLRFWPTTGNVNFEYCNPTAGSITPTAATLNWRVVR